MKPITDQTKHLNTSHRPHEADACIAGEADGEGVDGEGCDEAAADLKIPWTLELAEQPIMLGLFGETHSYGTAAFGAISGEVDAPAGEEGRSARSLAERRRRR